MVRKLTSTVMVVVASAALLASCGRSNDGPLVDGVSITMPPTTTAATVPPTTVPTTTLQETYTIQQGDTLSVIASRYGVSTQALADFNAISDVNSIVVGQELSIPPATPTTEAP